MHFASIVLYSMIFDSKHTMICRVSIATTRGKHQDDTGLNPLHLSFVTQANKAYTMERRTEWHSLGCRPRRTAFLEPYGVRAAVGTRNRYIREAVPHPRRSKESL